MLNPPINLCRIALLSHAINYGWLIFASVLTSRLEQPFLKFHTTIYTYITKYLIPFWDTRHFLRTFPGAVWLSQVNCPRFNPKLFFDWASKTSQTHISPHLITPPGRLTLRQKRASSRCVRLVAVFLPATDRNHSLGQFCLV